MVRAYQASPAHVKSLDGLPLELGKALDEDALLTPQVRIDVQDELAEFEHRLSTVEAMRGMAPAGGEGPPEIARRLPGAIGGATLAESGGARVRLKPEVIAARPDSTRLTSARLASTEVSDTVLMLGGVMLDTRRLEGSLVGAIHAPGGLLKEHCHFQAGVGDLLMVRQTLKAYELAEFAHVENVLAGEARVREHRRLNVREEGRSRRRSARPRRSASTLPSVRNAADLQYGGAPLEFEEEEISVATR